MSARAPLPAQVGPAQVGPVLAAYRDGLDAEQAPPLRGLYLVGSVALGGFRPGASDIAVVALLDEPPSAEATERLARVHAGLAGTGAPHLDGLYPTVDRLRQPAPGEARLPFGLEGRLRTDQVCREANPAVWRCLARSGRPIWGPPPVELGIADDDDALRAHQIANPRGYWTSWIAQAETALAAKAPREDCNAAALAWGVLGVGRSASTLATGDIVPKAQGGRYGPRATPAAWHPVLEEALAIHDGGPARASLASLRAALAYMRFVVTAVGQGARTSGPTASS